MGEIVTVNVSIQEFKELCEKIFSNKGFTNEEIAICSEEIVNAQCRGRLSHGAAIIPEVIEWKKEPAGAIEIVKDTPISSYIVGNNNIGPLVAQKAMDIAIQKAKSNGVGIVGVNNKFPFMLAGYNPRRAAEQGLIGVNWSVAMSKVAPWGSADPLIGTNPLGIAIPSTNGPIVLDMAVTEIAAAEIRRCNKLGMSLPDGVAISKNGTPTNSPKEALEGAMLPFGGYKGSGLGIIIELLGGAFVGAKVGKSVPGNRGMVFVALQCDLFVSKEKFYEDVSNFVNEVKNSRIREGFTEIHMPGERADKLLEKSAAEGIEIEEKIYFELLDLAK